MRWASCKNNSFLPCMLTFSHKTAGVQVKRHRHTVLPCRVAKRSTDVCGCPTTDKIAQITSSIPTNSQQLACCGAPWTNKMSSKTKWTVFAFLRWNSLEMLARSYFCSFWHLLAGYNHTISTEGSDAEGFRGDTLSFLSLLSPFRIKKSAVAEK